MPSDLRGTFDRGPETGRLDQRLEGTVDRRWPWKQMGRTLRTERGHARMAGTEVRKRRAAVLRPGRFVMIVAYRFFVGRQMSQMPFDHQMNRAFNDL